MKASFSLSIPNPCSEDWNSFKPTPSGGFCGSCNKNVIDFTKATEDEIMAFISRKPEHACGRFRGNQLKTYALLPPVKIRPGFTLLKAGAISLLLLFMGKQASAQSVQTKPATEIDEQVKPKGKQTENYQTTVRGVVTSISEELPVAGVIVQQKGTTNGVITDADGRYELKIDRRNGQVLTFSFIGLETTEIPVPESAITTIDVAMEDSHSVLAGEIVWTGQVRADELYADKKHSLAKFWGKVKGLFD